MKLIISLLICIIVIVSVKAQSECKTAIGENGKCVPLEKCYIIMDILNSVPKPWSKDVLNYLEKSFCDYRERQHYVCCADRHITGGAPTDTIVTTESSDNQDLSTHPSANLLPINECGRISESKLSNGNLTNLGEFPWMALLQYETADGLKFQCGGTLISKRYVLTAAHCVTTGTRSTLVSVRLGEYDTSTANDCEGTGQDQYCLPPVQDIPVETAIAHPQYNRPKFSNDVAVIRLSREANIQNENVLPICLPLTKQLQNTILTRAIISGWGITEKATSSNILLKAVIPVVQNDVCQRLFSRSALITSAQLCAGGAKGVDSCRGDSGGPLFFSGNVRGLRFVQYGVVSVGVVTNCGSDETYPGVYANVSHYLKWILDQMRS